MFRVFSSLGVETAECRVCGKRSELISKALAVCAECIKEKPDKVLLLVSEAHALSRRRFGLPAEPPRDPGGVRCGLCANDCRIPVGGKGYCGLRTNKDGRLKHLAGTPEKGIVECYYDPLPTNCVADGWCAGGAGAGYPKYSYAKRGPERGYKNLAVFYGACSFNCLFCQNWHYRENAVALSPVMSAEELASWADDKTSCICYFGGDPTPQMPHALKASKIALERASGRILRICWETNGSMSFGMLKKAAELSLKSGGTVKFDLKARDENLNRALCGQSNEATLKNFKWLAAYGKARPLPPFLVASTLLVPGYIDASEVEEIAMFIADLDPGIPYSLLGFYPHFYMTDMPTTSRRLAEDCLRAAKKHLKRVRIGNLHLLSG